MSEEWPLLEIYCLARSTKEAFGLMVMFLDMSTDYMCV